MKSPIFWWLKKTNDGPDHVFIIGLFVEVWRNTEMISPSQENRKSDVCTHVCSGDPQSPRELCSVPAFIPLLPSFFILKGSSSCKQSRPCFSSDPVLLLSIRHFQNHFSLLWICRHGEAFSLHVDDGVHGSVEDLIWSQVCSVDSNRRCVCVKIQFDVWGLLLLRVFTYMTFHHDM